MLYPKEIEQKIGFDKIKVLISENCLGPGGLFLIDKIRFSSNFDRVKRALQLTEEVMQILTMRLPLPASTYPDAYALLKKTRVEGNFLSEDELDQLRRCLVLTHDLLSFLNWHKEDASGLFEISKSVDNPQPFIKYLDKKIDDSGRIRDSASKELARLRSQIRTQQSRAGKITNQLLRDYKNQGYCEADAKMTIRNGRLVFPVLSEYKRSLKGFVHDSSSSGKFVYMEPFQVLDVNNSIKELEDQERRELYRILLAISDEIRKNSESIKENLKFLSRIDFIQAKAKFAKKFLATVPELQVDPVVELKSARHPTLWQKLKDRFVPLDIQINADQRILIISGPNAGGKSVCLKTVALLQYMMQSGIPIPVADNSKLGLFDRIFIDIGDEQSIEDDLSTYSSHLRNMKHFLKNSDDKTLFLIDELGSGTEPRFGGAIAESILVHLNVHHAYGIATTHYGNLKKFAEKTEGVVNAAMRFDQKALKPLYRLDIGKPGSSFSLEIAKNIGLSNKVLDIAKSKVGETHVNMDRLIQNLESEKTQYEELSRELNERNEKLKRLSSEYADLKNYVEQKKSDIMDEARKEASSLLDLANKKIEATIQKIKEAEADKRKTKSVRNELAEFHTSIKEALKSDKKIPAGEEKASSDGQIQVGDFVVVEGENLKGQVIGLKQNTAQISVGNIKSVVDKNRLRKTSKGTIKKEKKARRPRSIDLAQKVSDFRTVLDVRGKRVEEVLPEVEKFLDDALFFGFEKLKIIHGRGNGILRAAIRSHLKDYQLVDNIQNEHVERGGDGVTLVELK